MRGVITLHEFYRRANMAFKIEVEFDDADIQQLVDAYNSNADTAGQITIDDVEELEEDVKGALREFMFDQVIELLESENEEVYHFFVDLFDPVESHEDDLEEFEDDQPFPSVH
jgi:hypothetical protein